MALPEDENNGFFVLYLLVVRPERHTNTLSVVDRFEAEGRKRNLKILTEHGLGLIIM